MNRTASTASKGMQPSTAQLQYRQYAIVEVRQRDTDMQRNVKVYWRRTSTAATIPRMGNQGAYSMLFEYTGAVQGVSVHRLQ